MVARTDGGDQRPGVPALALGPVPGGADFPAAGIFQQPGHHIGARQSDPTRQREAEAGGDPQHIPLPVVFEELPQLRAAAVDLIPAHVIQRDPVRERLGADLLGQLALGAELQSSGRPMSSDFTGSSICSAGIHWRAPISACPVPSRTCAKCTVVIPLATLPTHPRYCRFTPAVAQPCLTWLVSSIAPTRRPRRLPPRRAASSSPATANRRTTPIAANASQHARLSSRWVRCGDRSPPAARSSTHCAWAGH
jgi:hypothetical protein